MRAAPSTADVPLRRKLTEHLGLLRTHLARRNAGRSTVEEILADIDEYAALLRAHTGRSLRDACVFEIGFGARPYRLAALLSLGVDVSGVDIETPALSGRPGEYAGIARRNGIERAAKSLVRRTLFDRREWRLLREALADRGHGLRLEPERLMVGDAAEVELPPDSLDLVISEDVFEHVPGERLPELVQRMAGWLKPDGLALIRPDVFTGVTGGHLAEWYHHTFSRPPHPRKSPPWGHLYDDTLRPNTTLNRLRRAEYRALFEKHFVIVDEAPKNPGLGREYLTDDVARKLQDYDEDELFSNRVLFVLRPLGGATG